MRLDGLEEDQFGASVSSVGVEGMSVSVVVRRLLSAHEIRTLGKGNEEERGVDGSRRRTIDT